VSVPHIAVRDIERRRASGTPGLERTIDMAKFIYLYRGPAPSMSDLTPEQGAERMAAFGAWMDKVGAALVDVGSPFGSSASIRDDGTQGAASDLIGYSIVEARDLAAAKAFTDGLPFLSNSDGKCAVEIFELLPM
jgi:YCII-related domain